MEIIEILSYYLNTDTNILDVNFRTINDNEDVLRNDKIDYSIVGEYGYELETESFDFFDSDEEEDEINKDEIELDNEELLNFLNEYYTVNANSLPKPDFF